MVWNRFCNADSIEALFQFLNNVQIFCASYMKISVYIHGFFFIYILFVFTESFRSSCSRFGSEENSSSITNGLDSIGSGDGPLRNTGRFVLNKGLWFDYVLCSMFYVRDISMCNTLVHSNRVSLANAMLQDCTKVSRQTTNFGIINWKWRLIGT